MKANFKVINIFITIQFSAWSLFSESVRGDIEDVHIVLGPRIAHLNNTDVSSHKNNNSGYDESNRRRKVRQQ